VHVSFQHLSIYFVISPDSSVNKAARFGLDELGYIPNREMDSSLHPRAETDAVATHSPVQHVQVAACRDTAAGWCS
jgi:hypothetical protein